MATTTSAPRTAAPTTTTTTTPDPTTFDLPASTKSDKLLARFSEARQQALYWEKELKAAKAEIKVAVGASNLPDYVPMIVRLRGAIRLKISWGTNRGTDRDLLLQGFPEAFEVTATESPYQIVTPA